MSFSEEYSLTWTKHLKPAFLVVRKQHWRRQVHASNCFRTVEPIAEDDDFLVYVGFTKKDRDRMAKAGFMLWPNAKHSLTFVYMPECCTSDEFKDRICQFLTSTCADALNRASLQKQVDIGVYRYACNNASGEFDRLALLDRASDSPLASHSGSEGSFSPASSAAGSLLFPVSVAPFRPAGSVVLSSEDSSPNLTPTSGSSSRSVQSLIPGRDLHPNDHPYEPPPHPYESPH